MDSGASKDMTRYKYSLIYLVKKESRHKVNLGDDYQYPIKGVGETFYRLESGKHLNIKDVLYVPGLKKNLLSILGLEEKGFRVAFVDGQVLMWPKGNTIYDVVVIGVQGGGMYKIKEKLDQALVHSTINLSDIWHRRFAHLHYKELSIVSKSITSIPKF